METQFMTMRQRHHSQIIIFYEGIPAGTYHIKPPRKGIGQAIHRLLNALVPPLLVNFTMGCIYNQYPMIEIFKR